MLSRWPIRNKLLVGIVLLLVIVVILAFSGFRGIYAFRGLAKGVSRRGTELPLATELAQCVSDLRATLSQVRQLPAVPLETRQETSPMLREVFRTNFLAVTEALRRYGQQLSQAQSDSFGKTIGDNLREWDTVKKINLTLDRIRTLDQHEDWMLDQVHISQLNEELELLHKLSGELPSFLHQRMYQFAGDVRTKYRTWIVLNWVTSIAALMLSLVFARLFYVWIFCPLQVLVEGSRRVAAGNFEHRIELRTQDEISELAMAMNAMTDRFQHIRDDLDRQVQLRTKQVVRSEQLASVGFLAAGVAHEINNPLASIALCAESLEMRLCDLVQAGAKDCDGENSEEITVTKNYLRMIQDEAFRCKQITSRLLDFSRKGETHRTNTDLVELVRGVIDMVGHVGEYKGKHIQFHASEEVRAAVNGQEIKQVVLNILANGLDSLDPDGTVHVHVQRCGDQAELIFADDGCGMTDEVLKHLFDPFFTRRRDGKGTGLGLSISYRIVNEHGGHIDASSEGPGTGSQFRVTLPFSVDHKENEHRYQVA